MHINDFKKQNKMRQIGMNQSDQNHNGLREQPSSLDGFKSQSGMRIVGLSMYHCTKCGMLSPWKLPTKCSMGGFHIWMKDA